MITWGIISTAMFLVTGPVSFYLLRFLLGVAEAGFFPGIILYLTYWFPARERAKAVALFMTAVAIAGVIGGPLSGALLSLDEVVFGLSGWQFLFIAEGFPAILLGLAVLAFLPDRPSEARWLTDEERRWLEDSLSREEQLKTTHGTHTLRQAFVDGRLWLLCGVYFGTEVHAAEKPESSVHEGLAQCVRAMRRLELLLAREGVLEPAPLLVGEPPGLGGAIGQEGQHREPEEDRRETLCDEQELPA